MSDRITVRTFEVRKDDFANTRVVEEPLPADLAENEVFLKVDRLALTANNISYAVTGESLGYWGFFPTEEPWGRIPAMGWAEVLKSNQSRVAEGERVWGWFPLATHLKVLAGNVSSQRFADVSPHRAALAPVYSGFDRATANPLYEPSHEDHDSLLRGLFITSWLVDDFLKVNGCFGSTTCLITSASSKTSIALAYCLKRSGELDRVGITSAANVDFCLGLGLYDRIVTYEELGGLDTGEPSILVDMAGNAGVLSRLHRHLGDRLKYSCRIGATHYDQSGPVEDLPGPRPEFFFAPAHIKSRSAEIGSENLMAQLGADYSGFRQSSDEWLSVERSWGPAQLEQTYRAVLRGHAEPRVGHIVSMWSSA